jgi:hypothetical protein
LRFRGYDIEVKTAREKIEKALNEERVKYQIVSSDWKLTAHCFGRLLRNGVVEVTKCNGFWYTDVVSPLIEDGAVSIFYKGNRRFVKVVDG